MIANHDLLVAPQTPDFLIDPDSPSSVQKMKQMLLARALWEEVDDCYHEIGKKKGQSKEAYVASLTKDEYETFVDRAQIRVVTTASKVRALSGRVSMSSAYDVLRKNTYRTIGEKYENFRDFLKAKLDEDDPQSSSTYEATFLLELIQSFESMGKGGIADKIFANKFVYGKLVTQIPEIRKKQNALVYAQKAFADLVGEIEDKQKTLRKEKSDARVRGEPEKVLKGYDDEIAVLEAKKAEESRKFSDVGKGLQADLTATAFAAVQLAGSNVPRAEVAQLLPAAAKVQLQKMGLKPEEVSSDYREEKPEQAKPKAYTVHLPRTVLFVFETNTRQSALVSKLLGEMFDLHLGELEEAIELLSKHRKKGA